jgi:hypothetical protein
MTPACVDYGWIPATSECYLYSTAYDYLTPSQVTIIFFIFINKSFIDRYTRWRSLVSATDRVPVGIYDTKRAEFNFY